ncbi:LytR C-terminal domain-containing protein [Prescottella equi]|uniref:LytR C-terminal domain-containing protein n=1 Tax=Rhodococcus hoagii TaxID=43767 RepID=UPI000A0F4289|nr:LytR C-terminal domain-containing protein [Prescottella equi]MBM4728129.1 LytR family transcriptional regulator [Prescottella equi]NKR27332.1 LytR family transcriptional regulator [Prescottella equi]NKR44901.1 LytR family transcriptional regulator [Prescottella equi]NKR59606.1 LytR family transcriptional regulator [Prescottella equi]NKR94522.1 LytR family transcriptional regulator [Prescottella equi]
MTTPNPESSGPPLRAIAMVLIALAILFAGLGAASLGGSDSDETATEASPTTATSAPAAAPAAARTTTAPTTTAAEPTTTTSTATSTTVASATTSARVDKSVPVRVFNNSTVSGLAAQTANELTSGGWNVSETGNYSYGQIQTTTVYYGSSASEKAAAQAIAAELGVKAEPRFAGIESASPGVIVIVTSG